VQASAIPPENITGIKISPLTQRMAIAMCALFDRRNGKSDRNVDRSSEAAVRSYRTPKSRRKTRMRVEVLEDRQLLWENDGVYVPDQASNPLNIAPTGNVIENNIIGLDAAGTTAIENHNSGV
jgi:hypothetical protein